MTRRPSQALAPAAGPRPGHARPVAARGRRSIRLPWAAATRSTTSQRSLTSSETRSRAHAATTTCPWRQSSQCGRRASWHRSSLCARASSSRSPRSSTRSMPR
eukprot:5809090-Prymnesium_polylepis.1